MPNQYSNNALDLLLEKVVDTYSFKIVHSKDCDNLAHAISNQCGETISGSTVKRLFGFIKTKSNPNKFTLNLLTRYIGFEDFDSFKTIHLPSSNKTSKESISAFTAMHPDYNNGVCSYDSGWERMDSFIASEQQATAIIGEAGTGKSSFIASYLTKSPNETTEIIFKTSVKVILEDLKKIDSNIRLLFIDDLEESVYNFKEIRECIIAVNKLISKNSKLKVVISMSSYTWVRIAEIISNSNLNSKWWKVNFSATNLVTASNITSFVKVNGYSNIPKSLRSPLLVKLSKNIIGNGVVNEWVIVNAFFDQKVWKTAHAFEKQQFFQVILEETKKGVESSRVKRSSLEKLIVKYKKAHLDLVSFNILSEQKELNKFGVFKSHYQFGNRMFFVFLILSELLEEYNGFNQALLHRIVNDYQSDRKIALLKLVSSFALSQYDENIVQLFDLELSEYERQVLMLHIADQIRENSDLQTKVLPAFVKSMSGRKYFIERWIDEENLNGFYGNTIKEYLKVVNSNQDVIFGNALLYYNAFLNNNESDCELYFNIIHRIDDTKEYIHPFVLGRKYMTLLLEEYRTNKKYSKDTLDLLQTYLDKNLSESNTDLPVHFSGFENNILHAEFLTGSYHFSSFILKKLEKIESTQLHEKDVDILMLGIFEEAFHRRQGKASKNLEYNLNTIHPWFTETVKRYVDRLE